MQILGSVTVTAATGAIVAQSGCVDSVTHNGAGDHTINLNQYHQFDSLHVVPMVSLLGAVAPSGGVTFGYQDTDDQHKRVTCVQEQAAGAASIAADRDFTVTFVGLD